MARQYELEIERLTGDHIVFPWHRDAAVSERPTRSASS